MSAKNWRRCPRCLRRAEAERAEKVAAAERSYGVVPLARFRRMAEEAEAPVSVPEAMREDYQLGVGEDGLFRVRYLATCQDCGFGYEYKFETRALPAEG